MILTFEDSSLLFFETLSFFKDRNIHRRNIFTKEFFCISRCFTDWIYSAEFNNSKRERKETLMRTLYDVCKFELWKTEIFYLLQGLSGDLGAREVLIGELREAAEPLREGCAAEVREKVEAAVNEAVQAWEDTRAELDALCTKYQHACRLWQQYKDSSAAVKAWVDTQMDSVANLPPEEAVKHIKVS